MIERTLYIALCALNCYKVFLKTPTKFFRAKTGEILFLNKDQNPIGNYYGLENMLPTLKLRRGICIKVKLTESKDECVITIMDRDVVCKVMLL